MSALGKFRSDLLITPLRTGVQTTYRVVDPQKNVEFQFHEVEFAVAKSLDGARDISGVVAAVKAKGFSVSPDHVKSFARELRGMGFVTDNAEPAPRATADHSSDAERFVKQGLAYLADGKLDFARSNLEAAAELDPANELAQKGLRECERMAQELSNSQARPPPGSMTQEMSNTLSNTQPGMAMEVEPLPRVNAKALMPIAGGIVILLVAIGAYHQFVLKPEMEARKELVAQMSQIASNSEKPAQAPAPTPQAPSPGPASQTKGPLRAAVSELTRPVLAQLTAPASGEVMRFLANDNNFVKSATRVYMFAFDAKRAAASTGDSKRIRELEELAKQDPEYEVFLERERKKAKSGGGGARKLAVIAGTAGFFVSKVAPDTQVRSGDLVAQIEDGLTVQLAAQIPAADVNRTWKCLAGPGEPSIPCVVDQVVPSANGVKIVAVSKGQAVIPWRSSTSLVVELQP